MINSVTAVLISYYRCDYFSAMSFMLLQGFPLTLSFFGHTVRQNGLARRTHDSALPHAFRVQLKPLLATLIRLLAI